MNHKEINSIRARSEDGYKVTRDDVRELLALIDKQAAVVGKLRHWLDMQKTMVAIQPISVGQQSYLNCLDAVREYLDSAKVSDE